MARFPQLGYATLSFLERESFFSLDLLFVDTDDVILVRKLVNGNLPSQKYQWHHQRMPPLLYFKKKLVLDSDLPFTHNSIPNCFLRSYHCILFKAMRSGNSFKLLYNFGKMYWENWYVLTGTFRYILGIGIGSENQLVLEVRKFTKNLPKIYQKSTKNLTKNGQIHLGFWASKRHFRSNLDSI